ncbi:UPF0496 protein At1g20180-like [Telopea speciosissima]|uniref:UPF0496 protein At1g20180-like n=1 Tax=Telopea speciosissima TaxID=54955 RepID=UPI001CC791A7|nr:UPF0496 protein At1g20180-like [Telopea speciosissima]
MGDFSTEICRCLLALLGFDFSFLVFSGESSREHLNNVSSKLNINEEYKEAFRTKSYIEIWGKVQSQMRRTTEDKLSLSPFPSYKHLSDYLLEPQQEILIDMIGNSNVHLHRLLIDYFECSLEATKICGLLLQSVDQTRADYRRIQSIINPTNRVSDFRNYTDDQCRVIFGELNSFSKGENPLSCSTSPLQFSSIHDRYGLMLDQLMLTHKKIARRAKFISLSKKVAGLSLGIACGALAIAIIVLVVHSIVGLAASPAIFTVCLAGLKKRIKSARMALNSSTLARLGAQLDAAAKGVYILNRDLDTMSRLVMKLHNEIEHSKTIAKMCVKNQKRQMLIEVLRDFKSSESWFLEQLGELEDHVCLCFLTINRARRLVIQEIMVQPLTHIEQPNDSNLNHDEGNDHDDNRLSSLEISSTFQP